MFLSRGQQQIFPADYLKPVRVANSTEESTGINTKLQQNFSILVKIRDNEQINLTYMLLFFSSEATLNENIRPSVCLSVRFRGKRDFLRP